jgi:hypothetical protein
MSDNDVEKAFQRVKGIVDGKGSPVGVRKNKDENGELVSITVYGDVLNLNISPSGNEIYDVTGQDNLGDDIEKRNISISRVASVVRRFV